MAGNLDIVVLRRPGYADLKVQTVAQTFADGTRLVRMVSMGDPLVEDYETNGEVADGYRVFRYVSSRYR